MVSEFVLLFGKLLITNWAWSKFNESTNLKKSCSNPLALSLSLSLSLSFSLFLSYSLSLIQQVRESVHVLPTTLWLQCMIGGKFVILTTLSLSFFFLSLSL